MQSRGFKCLPLVSVAALAACSQTNSIDTNGALYDGIAADETITLGGTEPFWDVTVTPLDNGSYEARVATLDDPDGTGPHSAEVSRFAGNNGLSFSGEIEGAPIIIAITPGECSDGMSDRTYPFVATVQMGKANLKGCGHTSATPFAGPKAP